jgi:hypothetical protein
MLDPAKNMTALERRKADLKLKMNQAVRENNKAVL